MKTISLLLVFALISLGAIAQDTGEKKMMVGGGEMSSYKNIASNIMSSKDHTKLVALLRSTGLVTTLQSPGPLTVFAATNDAFGKIGSMPSKAALSKVLLYHVIEGKWDSNDLKVAMNGNGGTVSIKTMQGGFLKFSLDGENLIITDENGATGMITYKDIFQSNGITHVVDTLMMPYGSTKSGVVSMQ